VDRGDHPVLRCGDHFSTPPPRRWPASRLAFVYLKWVTRPRRYAVLSYCRTLVCGPAVSSHVDAPCRDACRAVLLRYGTLDVHTDAQQ
jgi:hypothetical protein